MMSEFSEMRVEQTGNGIRTSKCQVFSFAVPEKKLANWRAGALLDFLTHMLSQIFKKLKGDPLETF